MDMGMDMDTGMNTFIGRCAYGMRTCLHTCVREYMHARMWARTRLYANTRA